MMSSSKKDRVVPPDDDRCVWMTAGILSYRLCDRTCDCDSCPLDAAMRKHFSRQAENGGASRAGPPALPASPEGLREGFRYARNHCWTRRIDDHALRIGIEPGLGLALLDPKAVVFPTTGQYVQKGQTCLWIVMEGGTLPFDSPCDGTICGTNRHLADQPYLLRMRPFDEGWLFEMEMESAATAEECLMTLEQAGAKYGEDEACFMKFLGNAMQSKHPQVGTTLADGGQRLQNLADVLGPGKYFSILRRVYGA